jgi:alkylation response protein AidB-like acyl-CoA dehydrogenase
MTELRIRPLAGLDPGDDRLVALDHFCAELAAEFREPGMLLDRDPDCVADLPLLRGVRFSQEIVMPAQYQSREEFPPELLQAVASTVGATILCERLAYGDPGVLMGSPGPSLSGATVKALGDDAQKHRYFSRVAAAPTYTFFGVTEPGKGSAATELETTLTPADDGDGWLLNGEKCYIGNGSRAELGVVFCRRATGPWGVEAVLVDTAAEGFHATPLPMMGLRGARFSRLRFDNVRIPPEQLLGAHRPPSRRGMHAATRTLYRARPGVAAFALGCAQAVCDYVDQERPVSAGHRWRRREALLDRIAAVRTALYRVAADIDRDVVNGHRVGAAKMSAAQVAQEATVLAAELLGPASLIEHPWLEKVYRDVRAFEIMEGTTNLHRLSVFQGLLKDAFL